MRVPLANGTLKAIPESVSDEAALLLGDNFSTGYYCAEMAEISPDGVYVVVGWLLAQVATTLEEAIGLPPWFDGLIVALLIIGLPHVLAAVFGILAARTLREEIAEAQR